MKQRGWVALGLGLVFAAAPAAAIEPKVGGGAFGGVSIPIVQDDNGMGAIYGVRVPVNLFQFLTAEPYFAHTGGGEAEETFGGIGYTRSGFEINTFGINAAVGNVGLAPGFSFFPYAGIGSYSLTRDGSDDTSEFGFQFGLGVAFSPIPALAVDARGEVAAVVTDQTSRKFGNITLGLTYKIFGVPGAPAGAPAGAP